MSDTIPPAPTPPPPPPPPPHIPEPREPETFSREYVQELRAESKNWRQKAQGHETAFNAAKAAADQAKADAEARIAEAKTAADGRIIRAELKAAAIRAGMVDMDGLKLLDLAPVKLDAAGEVVIPEGFFEAAQAAKPWLFTPIPTTPAPTDPPSPTPRSTSVPGTPPAPGQPAAKHAKDMTADEFKALERQLLGRNV